MAPKSIIKELTRNKREVILAFSSHSDDWVIGAGGTLAKYAQEGKKVIIVIFSYGEKSHPWLKEEVIQKMRSREAFHAGNLMDCEVVFFDLEDLKFEEGYKSKNLEQELLNLLEKERPTKLFTHCEEDLHPDHKAVYKITLGVWDKLAHKHRPEVYTYPVWNPVNFHTKYPSLYVNITSTFSSKLNAIKAFHSQKFHIIYPVILSVFRAVKDGIKIRKIFGEQFFRIR